jgi:cysteine-rich repeat protein
VRRRTQEHERGRKLGGRQGRAFLRERARDSGNTNAADGCTSACTICGNGIVTQPESCDDGNLVNGDGCDANCVAPGVCGNAVIDGDEECDDGGICIGSANAGDFCTDDDPQSERGTPITGVVTTGTVTGHLLNANREDGNDIGPFTATGAPFRCGALQRGDASGAAPADPLTALDRVLGRDIVLTSVWVASGSAPPVRRRLRQQR